MVPRFTKPQRERESVASSPWRDYWRRNSILSSLHDTLGHPCRPREKAVNLIEVVVLLPYPSTPPLSPLGVLIVELHATYPPPPLRGTSRIIITC